MPSSSAATDARLRRMADGEHRWPSMGVGVCASEPRLLRRWLVTFDGSFGHLCCMCHVCHIYGTAVRNIYRGTSLCPRICAYAHMCAHMHVCVHVRVASVHTSVWTCWMFWSGQQASTERLSPQRRLRCQSSSQASVGVRTNMKQSILCKND